MGSSKIDHIGGADIEDGMKLKNRYENDKLYFNWDLELYCCEKCVFGSGEHTCGEVK